jgi:hypothetical protein
MESINIHNRLLTQESYELIAVVCQFCELSVAPNFNPGEITKADKEDKAGSNERIGNRCELSGFLVSRFLWMFLAPCNLRMIGSQASCSPSDESVLCADLTWQTGTLPVILDRLELVSSEVRAGLANAWKPNL